MAHIEMRAELGIGDIEKAGKECKSESLMGKEGYSFVIGLSCYILSRIALVVISEG